MNEKQILDSLQEFSLEGAMWGEFDLKDTNLSKRHDITIFTQSLQGRHATWFYLTETICINDEDDTKRTQFTLYVSDKKKSITPIAKTESIGLICLEFKWQSRGGPFQLTEKNVNFPYFICANKPWMNYLEEICAVCTNLCEIDS